MVCWGCVPALRLSAPYELMTSQLKGNPFGAPCAPRPVAIERVSGGRVSIGSVDSSLQGYAVMARTPANLHNHVLCAVAIH